MKKEPVKVAFVGKGEDNFYQIKFPHLQVPVNVNKELLHRMLNSPEYQFENYRKKGVEKRTA